MTMLETHDGTAPRSSTADGTLTRRASLSLVNAILQHLANVAVMFVVMPIVIRELGLVLWGAWMMLQQTIGYLALGDLRPMSALKFSLAVQQHVDDADAKRRLVGAAVRLWVLTLPLLLLAGALLVWTAPSFIRIPPEHMLGLRIAMAVSVANLALDRLLTLPLNVLAGVNLEYRAMGMNALTSILSGVLSVAAVRNGYGLAGLAVATAAGPALFSVARFWVTRKAVAWFGMAKPSHDETVAFAKTSGWITVAALANLFLSATDVLLVGMLLGPLVAAVYGTTAAVLRHLLGPLTEILGSGSSGISDLCGRQEWARVERIRTELHLIALVLMSVVGVGVIALNRDFLLLWTKQQVYAGMTVNVLLVVLTVLALMFRAERLITASMMEFRAQTIAVAMGGIVAVAGGVITARFFGAAGMVGSLMIGYVIVLLVLGRVISARGGASIPRHLLRMSRTVVVMALLYAGAVLVEPYLAPRGWLELIAAGAVLSVVSLAAITTLGLGRTHRAILAARLTQALSAVRPRRAQ